jgi:hypothetical protein
MRKKAKRRSSDLVNTITNPVCVAIEKANMLKFARGASLAIYVMDDGADCMSLMHGIANTIATATKAIEGMDDPHLIGDLFKESLDLLVEASNRGFTWRKADADSFDTSLGYAIDVLTGISPMERVDAAIWTSQCEARAAMHLSAR